MEQIKEKKTYCGQGGFLKVARYKLMFKDAYDTVQNSYLRNGGPLKNQHKYAGFLTE